MNYATEEKWKWTWSKSGDGRGMFACLKYLCRKLTCVLSLWFFKYLSSINILKTALKFATGALFIRSIRQPQTAAPAKSVMRPCRDSSWRMLPGLWESFLLLLPKQRAWNEFLTHIDFSHDCRCHIQQHMLRVFDPSKNNLIWRNEKKAEYEREEMY